MPDFPLPLNRPSDCPLLTEEHQPLVDAFNQILGALDDVSPIIDWVREYLDPTPEERAEAARRERRAESLHERLERIRASLACRKYRVGVVGRSQVGKTASINHLLGAKILAEGTGDACTSIVTIVDMSPTPQEPFLQATYFTKEELQSRYRKIASHFRDQPCPVPELPELPCIPDARQKLQEWVAGVGSMVKKNALFLIALVDNFEKGQAHLGQPSSQVRCSTLKELEQRLKTIVAYRPDDTATDRPIACPLLVKDVRATVHISAMTPLIEIIDLPGLGTLREYDSELTAQYVKSLEGLLLFVSSRTYDNQELKTLTDALRKAHPDTSGRLWLVVSQMDKIDADYVKGPWFENLSALLSELGISADEIRFLSTYVDIKADESEEASKPLTSSIQDRKLLAKLLLLPWKNGEPQLPDPLTRTPLEKFASAFRLYMKDGGLAAFREIFESRVATAVRAATVREVRKELLSVIDDLRDCLANAETGGLDQRNRNLAADWAMVFLNIQQELRGGQSREERSRIAAPLFEALWGDLAKVTVENVRQVQGPAFSKREPIPLSHRANDNVHAAEAPRSKTTKQTAAEDEWVEFHETVTGKMGRQCESLVPAVVEAFGAQVQDQLLQLAGREPSLKADGSDILDTPVGLNPISTFEARVREIRSLRFFHADIEQLKRPTPIVNPLNGDQRRDMTPIAYVTVMRRKVETLCYRILCKVRVLMREECYKLKRQLARRSKEGKHVIPPEQLGSAKKGLDGALTSLKAVQDDDLIVSTP